MFGSGSMVLHEMEDQNNEYQMDPNQRKSKFASSLEVDCVQ